MVKGNGVRELFQCPKLWTEQKECGGPVRRTLGLDAACVAWAGAAAAAACEREAVMDGCVSEKISGKGGLMNPAC